MGIIEKGTDIAKILGSIAKSLGLLDVDKLPAEVRDSFHETDAPCRECPYQLGQIHTTVNPCPQCKVNSYHTYERFRKLTPMTTECEKLETN